MTAAAVRAAIALMWLQLLRINARLGSAAEVVDVDGAAEVVLYTGRDWSGAWVVG